MEKVLRQDYISFDVSEGITIEDFNEKYNQIISQLKDKYGYITDIKIHAECGTYNYDEDYFEEIEIKYKRYETNEEFGERKRWEEYRKNEQERKEIEISTWVGIYHVLAFNTRSEAERFLKHNEQLVKDFYML